MYRPYRFEINSRAMRCSEPRSLRGTFRKALGGKPPAARRCRLLSNPVGTSAGWERCTPRSAGALVAHQSGDSLFISLQTIEKCHFLSISPCNPGLLEIDECHGRSTVKANSINKAVASSGPAKFRESISRSRGSTVFDGEQEQMFSERGELRTKIRVEKKQAANFHGSSDCFPPDFAVHQTGSTA